MSAALLDIRALSVRLEGRLVLDRVDLRVLPGEIVTIVGPNGSGKSTLLRAAIGAVRPAAGEIRRRAGLRIGYVPQKLAFAPALPLSVGRFLDLPHRAGAGAAAELAMALERAGARGLETRQIAGLSGGQLQRVLLARALLDRPQLLLLDEAARGLDAQAAARFYRRIEALRRQRGIAVLMVSHDLHVVMAASDRVICLNGHVCCAGRPEQVAGAPQYRALFGTGSALALYRHAHDHAHDGDDDCGNDCGEGRS